LTRRPIEGPNILLASHILVNSHRSLAAKRLLERTRSELDTKTQTAIGNVILHGSLLYPSIRNKQQMRKVVSTLDLLVKKHDFVPDRVSVNILLKAMLRWRSKIDNAMLRVLFDHMVRIGYPPRHRLPGGGLPFGTPLSLPAEINLPTLSGDISFEKHVRPLYKIFIDAFYMRGDVDAAKIVVGYLKAESAHRDSGES
jgi:hypothetical protein